MHRNRMTMLDVLVSTTVTPEILRRRAEYWEKVAARNEKAGRLDQAFRLRHNVALMRKSATPELRLIAYEPPPPPPPAPLMIEGPKRKPKAPRPPRAPRFDLTAISRRVRLAQVA